MAIKTTNEPPRLDLLQRRGRSYWRSVVRTWPLARQRDWLGTVEATQVMGGDWCRRKRDDLDDIEERLKAIVPGGDWYVAAWHGTAAFPPQDAFNRDRCREVLKAWIAEHSVPPRRQSQLVALLDAGADPLQVLARLTTRMRLSLCATAYPAGRYDASGHPLPTAVTHRLTPPQSVGFNDGQEDNYDRLTPAQALFLDVEPSVSAVQFRQIEMRRMRIIDQLDRRSRRRLREEKLKAMREAHGVEDDAPAVDDGWEDDE